MDMLFARYACPFEFMRPYIEQGRFGEWVTEFIKGENKRRKEQHEAEEENKLWNAYVHSYSELTFAEWKAEVLKPKATQTTGKKDDDMTNADIDNLMRKLFKDS